MAAKRAVKRPPRRGRAATSSVKGLASTAIHRRRKPPENLRLRSAIPGFTVSDIERSIAWYRDVLGFVIKERWEQEGKLVGVELLAGSVTFMLSQDDWSKGRYRSKGEGFGMYCITVQHVDRLAGLIKARGGRLLHEPRDEPWGMRDLAVADPDGFKIVIANEKGVR